MQSTSGLRSLLLSTLGAPNHVQTTEQELYEELMAHKHLFLNLFDVGKRSPEQQRAVESGNISIRGGKMAVNGDFSRQVIFISQQLDCSEQYTAELLHDVMSHNPNLAGDRCVETTILEYHTRRRHVAECLKYVLDAAFASQQPDAPALYHRLEFFVREQMLNRPGPSNFTEKLLDELDSLTQTLNKVNVDRQNAGSVTVAPTQGGVGARLGYDILTARRDSLNNERSLLGTILFTFSRMGFLSGAEVSRILDWLKANSRHPIVYYYLPTVLAVFDIVDPDSPGAQRRRRLALDPTFVKQVNTKLQIDNRWTDPGLKATILLQWTIFMTEMRHRDLSLEDRDGFKADQLENNIWNAVQGDCFPYLTAMLLRLQRDRELTLPASLSQIPVPENDLPSDIPSGDFVLAILEVLEVVVRSLISYASSELRKIKQRQEDLLVAGMRADRSKGWRSTSQPTTTDAGTDQTKPPRNDIAAMFALMGLLYASLPAEYALPYWGATGRVKTYSDHLESTARKLPSFLQWAVWSTQPQNLTMLTALYDMLTGLANGERCSELAYNFLVRGGGDGVPDPASLQSSQSHIGPAVSWYAMFSVLESWAASGSAPRTNPPANTLAGTASGSSTAGAWQGHHSTSQHQPHHMHSTLSLSQHDVLVSQAFLHLLSTVATHSVAVRTSVCGHARFRAVSTLVSLIPLSIPLELKGTLFDTLSSFCQPGAGAAGLSICKSVWTLMERLEIISVRGNAAGPAAASVKGVEVELEEVESVYKVYPATVAFIKLLSTLIHTPKSISLSDTLTASESITTIPEGLGQPYRQPGISPYIHFVVDTVFLSISRREYFHPSDRWRMNDACLAFIERCLANFELETLAAHQDSNGVALAGILSLALHPGYEIMNQLLTHSALHASVLSYIVDGTDGFDKGLAEEQPFFRRTIVRILRIILRVLEIENLFLDVLVPLLNDASDKSMLQEVHPASYYVRLSQALFFNSDYVSAIATYVSYPTYLEARLLSVKIISILASPSTVRQLGTILDRSANSPRILSGFLSIITAESWVDVEAAEIEADRCTGAGGTEATAATDVIVQAIRVALLDFLAINASADLPYPNISHFILFGQLENQDQIRDSGAVDGQRACIHALLDLLNTGIPRWRSQESEIVEEPLFRVLPGLAERCYGVVHRLCKHPSTTAFTSRYLRTREDFFVRHMRAIPCKVPAAGLQPSAEVVYQDGTRVGTTVSALCSFLRLRSCILDLIALELHALTAAGQHKGIADLLAVLFEASEGGSTNGPAYLQNEMFRPFKDVGQTQSKIIELLQLLVFDWSDGLSVQPTELRFLSQLNLLSCVHPDRVGCEIIDRTALLSLLSDATLALHSQGHVATSAQSEEVANEVTYVLQSCAVENHRRQVQHAVATSFEAWGDVLNTALLRCFSHIALPQQESILLDLLHVLPLSLQSTGLTHSTTVILAESILTTLCKLHEMIQGARSTEHQTAVSLPPERLHSFLRNLLSCIVHSGRSQVVRGNLYACLIHYLRLVLLLDGDKSSHSHANSPNDPESWTQAGAQQVRISESVELILPLRDRLLGIMARDACDGTEVWRTVALLALDTLIKFANARCGILEALSRSGNLQSFVQRLKDGDVQLQNILSANTEDLNALYAYEGEMSLFVRIAEVRKGAEQLFDDGILKTLAQCDFLDAQPEAYDDTAGITDYMPSVSQRYHQMLMPGLRLVAGISASLESKHDSAVKQILEFLSYHRDAFVSLLRSNADSPSEDLMEEAHFLVSICLTVVQGIPSHEVHSISGYGSLHVAIIGFAARFLSRMVTSDKDALWLSSGSCKRLVQTLLLYMEVTDGTPNAKTRLAPTLHLSQSEHRLGPTSSPTFGDFIAVAAVLTSVCSEIPQQLHFQSHLDAVSTSASRSAKTKTEKFPNKGALILRPHSVAALGGPSYCQLIVCFEIIFSLLMRHQKSLADPQSKESMNLKIKSLANEVLQISELQGLHEYITCIATSNPSPQS